MMAPRQYRITRQLTMELRILLTPLTFLLYALLLYGSNDSLQQFRGRPSQPQKEDMETECYS
jgi:hypothetical protein